MRKHPASAWQSAWVKLVVSLGLMAYLIHQTNWASLGHAYARLPLWVMPACLLLYLASQWLSAMRWQRLAQSAGMRLSTLRVFQLCLTGMFYNQFLPGTIGGDGYRAWQMAHRTHHGKRLAVLSLLAERGLGFASLIWISGVCALWPGPQPSGLIWALTLLMVVSLIGYGIVSTVRWSGRLAWLQPARQLAMPAVMLWPLCLSVGVQLLMILIHLLLANGLGITVSPLYLTLTYGSVVLLTLLPISLNGLGLREMGYVGLLGLARVPAQQAMTLSLLWFSLNLLTSLLGALPMLPGWERRTTHQQPRTGSSLA